MAFYAVDAVAEKNYSSTPIVTDNLYITVCIEKLLISPYLFVLHLNRFASVANRIKEIVQKAMLLSITGKTRWFFNLATAFGKAAMLNTNRYM